MFYFMFVIFFLCEWWFFCWEFITSWPLEVELWRLYQGSQYKLATGLEVELYTKQKHPTTNIKKEEEVEEKK